MIGSKGGDAEIVIDQEAAGGALADENANVPVCLFGVQHMDHRQDDRAGRLEKLVKFPTRHAGNLPFDLPDSQKSSLPQCAHRGFDAACNRREIES